MDERQATNNPVHGPEELTEQVERLPVLAALRSALRGTGLARGWLLGEALRELALGRTPERAEVGLPAGTAEAAAELASRLGGSDPPLELGERRWRVDAPGLTVDLVPLADGGVGADLSDRDFTVNALAFDLLGGEGLLDPLGGLRDLAAGRLVGCSATTLDDDPIRVLRVYRFAFGLGLEPAAGLRARLRPAAAGLRAAPPERVRTELFAVLALPRGARALRAMVADGPAEALFHFLGNWSGFDQGSYHAHDLLEHSLRAAEAAEDLACAPGELTSPAALAAHLGGELEPGLSRAALLKFAAFFHDVAKPETVTIAAGRRRFLGHDGLGGHRMRGLLQQLRAGKRARAAGQRMVAAHLRLYGLARQQPPTRTARLRFLRDLGAESPEAVLLAVADEVATGPAPPHLTAVRRVAAELLSLFWERKHRGELEPLLRGRDLVDLLGVPEGPAVGELLRRAAAAEASGAVGTRADALALAKKLWDEQQEGRTGRR